jgi:ATP-dependent DNA helicase DinG
MSNKFVVIDLETTGNSPKKGDKIIQFAAVVIEDGRITEKFSSLLYPEQSIPAFIEELTGLTDEMVKDAPLFSEIAPTIMELLDGAYFVAHNVLFDLSFLQEELIMAGYEGFYGPVLDTVEMARILFPSADSYKLSDLALQEGLSHVRPHQADSDAYVTGELLLILFSRLEKLPLQTIRQLLKLSGGLKSDLDSILEELVILKESRIEELPIDLEIFRGLCIKTDENDYSYQTGDTKPKYPLDDDSKEEMFKKAFDDFEKRVGQFQMMDIVQQSFETAEHAMIEAGTGVGKSLAYLVPSVLHSVTNNIPVVISTQTTQLQEQLLSKDIPKLKKMIPYHFNAVLLKGRGHYISLEKFERSLREEDDNYDTTLTKMQILVWLTVTVTGDRDELHLSSGGQIFWNRIKHDKAKYIENKSWIVKDYYLKMKRQAQMANLIITNHSLLLTDLVSEHDLLPSYDYVVIDEGHHFQKVASKHFGSTLDYSYTRFLLTQMGNYEQKNLLFELENINKEYPDNASQVTSLSEKMTELQFQMDDLFRSISIYAKKQQKNKVGRVSCRFSLNDKSKEIKSVQASAENFLFTFKDFFQEITLRCEWLKGLENNNKKIKSLLVEVLSWLENADRIITSIRNLFIKSDERSVIWIEIDTRSLQNATTVYSQPVTVANELEASLFQKKKSVVITSATLSVKGSFHYMMNELGLNESNCKSIQIDSPFEFDKQVQLVISNDLPEINTVTLEEYVASIGEHIISIAESTKGRMLILFTSYDMLKKTYELIKESGFLQDYSLMAQGITSGSRARLTRNFQRFEKSILLGTNSFWEGIDIPGEDLSCLVMVRLPFSSPDEPITEAKCAEIKRNGGNPFSDYSLPEAVIRFKQGFGRLIRTKADRGIIIVFDKRITSTKYGKVFLESLPNINSKVMPIEQIVSLIQKWL